ncbi:hypothetical protein ACJIZ3_007056 [Penstemon smallii]|uniref:peptidylprolyl isomerase n=1 Tax=Penstemon smallii TaxID=265156 RepID=A0ABD3S9F6_9LAMI
MEVHALQIRIQFPHLSGLKSVGKTKELKVDVHKNLENRFSSLAAKQVLRREIFRLVGLNLIFADVCTVLAAPMQEMKEPDVLRTLKLASGVRLQDIVEGQGKEAREGDLVEFHYVCRRSNGYFVHSTVDQFSGANSPVILPLDNEQMIEGLKEVLVGMKVGG